MEKPIHLPKRAIVIGAGVSGLSTGISLLRDGWIVKIIAEKVTPNTTSDGVVSRFYRII
jgi:glycine/D-amino acid oxidase-like deaminating enzyme